MDFNGNPGSPVWTFDSQTEYMLSLYGEIDSSCGEAIYYHGDMIGSTMITSRLESDPPGQESVEAVAAVAYTAFGEHVELTGVPDANDPNDANATIWSAVVGGALPAEFPRYAYAGQHGYESGLLSRTGANPNLPPITLQHLGWRWYDPSIGRFVQRDPIGIAGGMNVYLYAGASPLNRLDPSGLADETGWDIIVDKRSRGWVNNPNWRQELDETAKFGMCIAFAGASANAGLFMSGLNLAAGYTLSAHAVEQMALRGVPMSAILEALKWGSRSPGNKPATTVCTFENVTVVVNHITHVIVTVIKTGHR